MGSSGEAPMTDPTTRTGGRAMTLTTEQGTLMQSEGVYQVRWHERLLLFTVELQTGQIGGGRTIRDAIEKARQDPFCGGTQE